MFETVSYQSQLDQDPLKQLVEQALESLRKGIIELRYPEELCRKHDLDVWRLRYKEIDKLNKKLLTEVTRRSGVYALLVAKPDHDWTLKYIGQSKAVLTRQRIRSHVVWRNKDTPSGKSTGSQFDNVRNALMMRHNVAVAFVEIQPASLRYYVEEMLLGRKHPVWNLHGTTLAGQTRSRQRCHL